MPYSDAELAIQRALTEAWIAVNPTEVNFLTISQTHDGEGWIEGGGNHPAQIVRLADQSSTSSPVEGAVRTADGVQRKSGYQLVGRWDMQLALRDYWVDADGIRWEVDEIFPDNGYERRAKLVRYGES